MVLAGSARRFAVLGGAGVIGRVIVRDLFESSPKHAILIADADGELALRLANSYCSSRVSGAIADARDSSHLAALLRGYSVVINCTRHQFNLDVMKAALLSRVAYLDLGGLFHWTRRQLKLHRQFKRAGLTAVDENCQRLPFCRYGRAWENAFLTAESITDDEVPTRFALLRR